MKNSSKLAIFLIVLAAAGAVVLWKTGVPVFGPPVAPPADAGAAPPPTPVSVAKVEKKSVIEWDEFSGRVRAIDQVEIRPQVSGIIEQVHFQDGQLVRKGDLLFTIDPRPFQAALDNARAVEAGAEAKLALAKTNLERNKNLIASHAIAQSDLDNTNDAFLEANAALQAAQAAVQTAQLNLNYTAITAPVSGRVSRAEITAGNLVGDGPTAPALTTLVSVSPVYVEFEIDEQTYLKYLANGADGNSGLARIPVEMGLANQDDYPRRGRLESIDNQLDTSSGTIRVRAVFDDPSGDLTPGLYAKVRTGGSASETALLVDDRAIGTDQDKKFVMVVDAANKATYRAVTLGPMVNGLRIVRSGLEEGERIVVNGLQRVRPNDIVAPTEVAMDRQPAAAPLTVLSAK
jgi:multidrug efflux system membrane fusion protein